MWFASQGIQVGADSKIYSQGTDSKYVGMWLNGKRHGTVSRLQRRGKIVGICLFILRVRTFNAARDT